MTSLLDIFPDASRPEDSFPTLPTLDSISISPHYTGTVDADWTTDFCEVLERQTQRMADDALAQARRGWRVGDPIEPTTVDMAFRLHTAERRRQGIITFGAEALPVDVNEITDTTLPDWARP
jgi:hypothetical protein